MVDERTMEYILLPFQDEQMSSHRRARRPMRQVELPLRTWGGRRPGAGRKPKGSCAGVPHRLRPEHKERHPVHVTLRVTRGLPSLRGQSLFNALRPALAKSSHASFRLVHLSVQSDHVHLVVEAQSKASLSRGIAGLSIRMARSINRELGRCGRVLADRYHARPLTTPRDVRHCLVYVLMNFKKHRKHIHVASCGVDGMSSAPWFDGWKESPKQRDPPDNTAGQDPLVRPARTWLARTGWRRHGLIRLTEQPSPP